MSAEPATLDEHVTTFSGASFDSRGPSKTRQQSPRKPEKTSVRPSVEQLRRADAGRQRWASKR